MSGRRAQGLLIVAFVLFVAAWSFTTPLDGGPDEPAHYVRALSVGGGQLLGRSGVWSDPSVPLKPAQRRYMNSATTRVAVPASLAPTDPTIPCFAFRPFRSAACASHAPVTGRSDVTYVGRYQPLYYLIPGLIARRFDSPAAGLRAARLASIAVCLLLLAVALVYLRNPIGLLAAVSPMVLSLSGTLSSSAFEIASAVAFIATTLALLRRSASRRTASMWLATGTCLAWSRPLGPAWVFATVLVVAVTESPPVLRQVIRAAAIPIAVLTTVCLGSIVWDILVVAHGAAPTLALGSQLSHAFTTYPAIFRQQVGLFGWLDTFLPRWLYDVWAGLLVLLLALAISRGTNRQRLGIAAAIVLYLIAVIAVDIEQAANVFAAQGRYTLPIMALPLILAGETLPNGRRVLGAAGTAWIAVTLIALDRSGRRYAVGTRGRQWFIFHSAWQPPGGWPLWASVAIVAAVVAIATLGFASGWRDPRPLPRRPLVYVARHARA